MSLGQCRNATMELLRHCMEEFSSHGINHALKVEHVALDIFNHEKNSIVDKEEIFCEKIVQTSALLHDITDKKVKNSEANKPKLDSFLKNAKLFSNLEARYINWIIDHVSYSKEKKYGIPTAEVSATCLKLRDIVSDADKIDAIGYEGTMRCILYQKEHFLPSDPLVDYVIQHHHDKLLKLAPLYIRTDRGKEIAEPLHAEMVKSCQWLEKYHRFPESINEFNT